MKIMLKLDTRKGTMKLKSEPHLKQKSMSKPYSYFRDPTFYWSWAFIIGISMLFGWGLSWAIPCVSIPVFALIYWLMRKNP